MAKKRHDPIPPLEWAAAGLGLLVALLLVAILGREAVAGRDDPPVPVLVAEVERAVATASGYVIEVRVRNLSNQTAAAVQVEGKIKAGLEEETSSATIDYVPGRSQATGGIIFSTDPRGGPLELRVTGYEIP